LPPDLALALPLCSVRTPTPTPTPTPHPCCESRLLHVSPCVHVPLCGKSECKRHLPLGAGTTQIVHSRSFQSILTDVAANPHASHTSLDKLSAACIDQGARGRAPASTTPTPLSLFFFSAGTLSLYHHPRRDHSLLTKIVQQFGHSPAHSYTRSKSHSRCVQLTLACQSSHRANPRPAAWCYKPAVSRLLVTAYILEVEAYNTAVINLAP